MKRLPIGIEDFKELIEKEYYYVDKTMFIKNVLEERWSYIQDRAGLVRH